VHNDSDIRQTEIHTPEPLAPDFNSFEVEIATAKLQRYKLSGRTESRKR
jgi:hypothetical protein